METNVINISNEKYIELYKHFNDTPFPLLWFYPLVYNKGFGHPIFLIGKKIIFHYNDKSNYTLSFNEVKEKIREEFRFEELQFLNNSKDSNTIMALAYAVIDENEILIRLRMKSFGWERISSFKIMTVNNLLIKVDCFTPNIEKINRYLKNKGNEKTIESYFSEINN